MSPYLLLLLAALGFVVVEMSLTFALAQRLRNYGVVDIVWSAGFAILALLYFGLAARMNYDVKLNGFPEWSWSRAGVLTGMIVLWSGRLGGHLFHRVRSHHPVEDVRYAELRREWGSATARKMFGFFQLQGGLQVVLSLPFLLAFLNPNRQGWIAGLGTWELIGLAFWIVGLSGEALADAQLSAFRNNPTQRGKVCQVGLWYYSRHPNYFFEWLIWLGYATFALGAPLGWLGFLAPLLMWHFLVNVTGIPLTEALSLKSKGAAYREYQRTTSAFFPWVKRA